MACVIGIWFVDEMHQEEHIVCQVMLFGNMCIKAVRYCVEIVLANTAYETVGLHVIRHRLQLITQLAESIDDQTCTQMSWSTESRPY